MVVYNLLLLLCIPNIFVFNKKLLFLTLLVLCVFCGAREGVLGYDYFVYENFYNEILISGNKFGYEPLFYSLAYTSRKIGFSYHEFIFLIAIFFHVSLYRFLLFLRKETNVNIGLTLCLYISTIYFWHSYTLVRQSISISIFYLTTPLLFRKGRFSAINYLGIGFHAGHISSIIVQLWVEKKTKLKVFVLLILSIVFFIYFVPLVGSKIEQYNSGRQSGIYPIIEFLFIFIVLCIFRKSQPLFIFIAGLGVFISLLAFFCGEVLIRFIEPLKIIVAFGLAYIFSVINRYNNNFALLYALILIAYCFFRLNFFFANFGEFSIPYKSLFI